jgi:hypothetical protein
MATVPGDYFDEILKRLDSTSLREQPKPSRVLASTTPTALPWQSGERGTWTATTKGEGNIYKFYIEYDCQPHHCHSVTWGATSSTPGIALRRGQHGRRGRTKDSSLLSSSLHRNYGWGKTREKRDLTVFLARKLATSQIISTTTQTS